MVFVPGLFLLMLLVGFFATLCSSGVRVNGTVRWTTIGCSVCTLTL